MNRPIGYTRDGKRIYATRARALEAQERMARELGIFSGVTKTPEGFVMVFDPWAHWAKTLDIY